MSPVNEWANWNDRQTRKRESVDPAVADELHLVEYQPMQVEEKPLSDTFIQRLKRWPWRAP